MILIPELLILTLISQQPKKPGENHISDIFINITIKHNNSEYVKAFDLDDASISALMVKKMNTPKVRGGISAAEVLRHVIKANPGKTFEWLLDHYGEFSTFGLTAMADGLRHIDNRESYQLLSKLLHDRREVVNEWGAQISPPPYMHMRVCDEAYHAFAFMLDSQKALPTGMPHGIFPSHPIDERDRAIKGLTDWWAKSSSEFLQKKPSLSATRPSIANKMWSMERGRQ